MEIIDIFLGKAGVKNSLAGIINFLPIYFQLTHTHISGFVINLSLKPQQLIFRSNFKNTNWPEKISCEFFQKNFDHCKNLKFAILTGTQDCIIYIHMSKKKLRKKKNFAQSITFFIFPPTMKANHCKKKKIPGNSN